MKISIKKSQLTQMVRKILKQNQETPRERRQYLDYLDRTAEQVAPHQSRRKAKTQEDNIRRHTIKQNGQVDRNSAQILGDALDSIGVKLTEQQLTDAVKHIINGGVHIVRQKDLARTAQMFSNDNVEQGVVKRKTQLEPKKTTDRQIYDDASKQHKRDMQKMAGGKGPVPPQFKDKDERSEYRKGKGYKPKQHPVM